MKTIILILSVTIVLKNNNMMNEPAFEKLLGEHVSSFEKVIGSEFDNKLFQKKFYYILDTNVKKSFYGMFYNTLSIMTDDRQSVESITIHFHRVMDRAFYSSFIEEYGEPDSIQIIKNRRIVNETKTKEGTLRKSEIDLQEGNFDEKPLYITWKKNNFIIKAFLRHKQNISEITFSIK